jgi:hypothetical protein
MPRRRLHNLTYRHPLVRLYVTDASSDIQVAPATTARLTLQGPDLSMSLLVTVNVGQMRITAREGRLMNWPEWPIGLPGWGSNRNPPAHDGSCSSTEHAAHHFGSRLRGAAA